MRKTNSVLWNTFLCNRLSSLESNIRTARTVRLGVITVAAALIGVGKYLFDISELVMFLTIGLTVSWYFVFSMSFFKSDHVIKKYEVLLQKNIGGKLSGDEIFQEYIEIRELENSRWLQILKGRFWRYYIKLT